MENTTKATASVGANQNKVAPEGEPKLSPWVKDLRGQKFGRLTIGAYQGIDARNNATWLCACECGKSKVCSSKALKCGDAKSCGCAQADYVASLRTHGMTHTPEFKIWTGIATRTVNPNDPGFRNYGARGIQMCERWRKSFESFYEDMGPRPSPKHTVDRIKNDLGYSKENCRWATQKEQQRNRRNNHLVTYKGETHPLVVWTERLGFRKMTLRNRLVSGWSVERAMTEPEKEKVLRHPRRRTL